MITTLTNLTMEQALNLIKGTKNTVYRTKWINELGKEIDPAMVSIGEEEDVLYFIIDDEPYAPTIEDITANDWCILTEVEQESGEGDDNQYFDEIIEEMTYLLLELHNAQVTLPRFAFFQALADMFMEYYGVEAFGDIVETGEINHNEECECPACVEESVLDTIKEMVESNKLSEDEMEEVVESMRSAMLNALSKLVK